MDEILIAFQHPYAWRALIASVMVGVMCGALGCFIVLRNMAMFGDALSHAILPGIVVAFIVVGGYSAIGFFLGSVAAGLLSAIGITWIQQKVSTKNDAAIGIVFTTMFALGVMGISWLSKNEHAHIDLRDFLFGNVLGVSDSDLVLTGMIMCFVIASIVFFYRPLFVTTFQPVVAKTMGVNTELVHYYLMLLLSFAIVAALQTVGVILVVATLITPAATGLLLSKRLPVVIVISSVIGMLSAVIGLLLSIAFKTTPSPAMAVVASIFYLLAVCFAPEKGLVFKYFRKLDRAKQIQKEDILKRGYQLAKNNELSIRKLAERTMMTEQKVKLRLSALSKEQFVILSPLSFTQNGLNEAERLIRAHRLYETYLVNKLGLSEDQIHDEAERYEHLLTQDILDDIDKELGFPDKDPHGSPIPSKKKKE